MSDTTFKGIFKGKESKLQEKLNVDEPLLSLLEEYNIIASSQKNKIKVYLSSLIASFNLQRSKI